MTENALNALADEAEREADAFAAQALACRESAAKHRKMANDIRKARINEHLVRAMTLLDVLHPSVVDEWVKAMKDKRA